MVGVSYCFFLFYIISADSENEKVTYLITVATGSLKGAGTNASVSLVIKGTKTEKRVIVLGIETYCLLTNKQLITNKDNDVGIVLNKYLR